MKTYKLALNFELEADSLDEAVDQLCEIVSNLDPVDVAAEVLEQNNEANQ